MECFNLHTFKILRNAVSNVGCTSTFDPTTCYLVDKLQAISRPIFPKLLHLTNYSGNIFIKTSTYTGAGLLAGDLLVSYSGSSSGGGERGSAQGWGLGAVSVTTSCCGDGCIGTGSGWVTTGLSVGGGEGGGGANTSGRGSATDGSGVRSGVITSCRGSSCSMVSSSRLSVITQIKLQSH